MWVRHEVLEAAYGYLSHPHMNKLWHREVIDVVLRMYRWSIQGQFDGARRAVVYTREQRLLPGVAAQRSGN